VGIKENQRLGVSLDDEAAGCKASLTYEETTTQLYMDRPCAQALLGLRMNSFES